MERMRFWTVEIMHKQWNNAGHCPIKFYSTNPYNSNTLWSTWIVLVIVLCVSIYLSIYLSIYIDITLVKTLGITPVKTRGNFVLKCTYCMAVHNALRDIFTVQCFPDSWKFTTHCYHESLILQTLCWKKENTVELLSLLFFISIDLITLLNN